MIDWVKITGFDWDKGNLDKIVQRHRVQPIEAEQVFKDEFLIIFKDYGHSEREQRFNALGRTKAGRRLIVAFTLRDNDSLIRVISARNMSVRERSCYD